MTSQSKRYALAVDSRKCINCKACSVACRAENRVPPDKRRNWLNEEHRGEWPKPIASFEPEQCHHCADPACVRVCPTGASRQRPDGVVVIDATDCVGCHYCILACPYEARFFREDEGVAEKCDFCAQRLERKQLPACVETCPSKVRTFGDLNLPGGELRKLLDARRYFTKKSDAGTQPHIFYLI